MKDTKDKKMKSWQYKFLEKTLLGQKTNINNQHEVIQKCIKLACKDMLVACRYYIKNIMIKFVMSF